MSTQETIGSHRTSPRSGPATPAASSDRYFLWCMAAYGILYVLLYPRIYTSLDESANFGMAYVLRHGTLLPARAGYALAMSPMGPHGPVYRFPIGYPAILALASLAGSGFLFALNPIMHLVASRLFSRILIAARIPAWFAVLYLLYPGFVLYNRTIFSDAFAASLTTIALFFLLNRGTTAAAGVFLGLATTIRSTSAVVACIIALALVYGDLRDRSRVSVVRGRFIAYVLGVLPFLIVNAAYNAYTLGNPCASTYSPGMLSLTNLPHYLPLYAASLLAIYPGMLAAPFVYRGPFRVQGLLACSAVFLIAASYYETTYGANPLENLLSVTRQILPAAPFFLLAYCGVLDRLTGNGALKPRARVVLAFVLLASACVVSVVHQRSLNQLVAMRNQIRQTIPAGSVVYANKDVFKLHQPIWDSDLYRELPETPTPAEASADLRRSPVYVVVYFRSRGIAHEDSLQQAILTKLGSQFVLKPAFRNQTGPVQYYRVCGIKGIVRQE